MSESAAKIAEEVLRKVAFGESSLSPTAVSIKDLKKKLKVGDIILTKPRSGPSGRPKSFLSRIISKVGGSPWTHGGVYIGDGKVQHLYPAVLGKSLKPKSRHKLRTHSLKTIDTLGNDILALRPKVEKKVRDTSVERLKKLKNVTYDYIDFVRAGFFPEKLDKREKRTLDDLDTAICTGVVAAIYPNLDFRSGMSALHVRPGDIATSSAVKPIASFIK